MDLKATSEDLDPRFRKVGEKAVGTSKAGRNFTSIHRRITPLDSTEEKAFADWIRICQKPGFGDPVHGK